MNFRPLPLRLSLSQLASAAALIAACAIATAPLSSAAIASQVPSALRFRCLSKPAQKPNIDVDIKPTFDRDNQDYQSNPGDCSAKLCVYSGQTSGVLGQPLKSEMALDGMYRSDPDGNPQEFTAYERVSEDIAERGDGGRLLASESQSLRAIMARVEKDPASRLKIDLRESARTGPDGTPLSRSAAAAASQSPLSQSMSQSAQAASEPSADSQSSADEFDQEPRFYKGVLNLAGVPPIDLICQRIF